MKKIFDWLREQISKESWLCKPRTKEHYSDDAVFVEDAMNIINEAEAKWEAEKEKIRDLLWDCYTNNGKGFYAYVAQLEDIVGKISEVE